jgi:hypothetical protein
MTTSTIVTALTALSCDAYTVTATVRGDTIVASYHATDDDLGQAEHDGADASARIAEVLEAAGYTFSDAGGDDPGIYEVWHAPAAERAFIVEGCGADQTLTATSAEAAAQEAAEWQHGADGAHVVTLTWRDAGSDATTVAVYGCEVDGAAVGRVTVREAGA